MEMIIPAPASSRLNESARCRLGSVPRLYGPAWTETICRVLADHAPWPAAAYAGAIRPLDRGSEKTRAGSGIIVVRAPEVAALVPSALPDSSYAVTVAEGGVEVACSEPSGLVQALRTIGGLRGPGGTIPLGSIDDAPRFPYRGVHLDVGRHFFDVAFIRRLLTLMAGLGFDVFHWHLTDDQGWRLPVPEYPRLTDVGAWRTEVDGSRYGGFYTEDEITEIVSFAGRLGILVMPEIELPGHATAAIAAYPELSCRQLPVPVSGVWGIHEEVFCAGNDALFTFLDSVFDQVCRLFPSELVHIGGDECVKTRWHKCDRCRARIEAEGLADFEALQSYVIGRAAQMLASRGRRAIGWDEILEGGLPANALVMSWRGTEGGIAAAEAGHRVVMTPTSHCYFDYRQVDAPDATGFAFPDENGRIPVTTIAKVLQFNPIGGLSPAAAKNVLGGQANVWSETLESDEVAERMIAPRILAMAEALWTAPANRDFSQFAPRARAALRTVEEMGWRCFEAPELR